MESEFINEIKTMLEDAVKYYNEFVEAPKLKEYSKKVAAQDLVRKARKKIDVFNKEITTEYRKRLTKKEKKVEQTPQAETKAE